MGVIPEDIEKKCTLKFYCKDRLESIELGVAREPTSFVVLFWEKRPLGCFLIDSYIDLSV